MTKNNYQKIFISLSLLLLSTFFGFPKISQAATSVTQYGITWTFDADYTVGQFVNGDYWVVGPVTIDSKTPAWTGADHGSILDPAVGGYNQPFHSGTVYNTPFSDALRVSFPVTISSGVHSLVSTITDSAYTGTGTPRSFVRNAAVLTIVNSAPSATSFRPPFVAGAKPFYDSAMINYSLIPSYVAPGATLDLTGYANMPTLNYGGKTFGEENWMPSNDYAGESYPPYAEIAFVSRVSLMMLVDTPNRISYINKLIQIGIDDYSKWMGNDFAWIASGGYGGGHLWPILFAGRMLNNSAMMNVTRYSSSFPLAHNSAEQGYTYYNNNGTVMFGSEECLAGQTPYPPTACSNNMCRPLDGLLFPEVAWGSCGGGYRCLVSAKWAGPALAMRVLEPTLGTMTLFNHPAYFDYTDYWVANPKDSSGQPPASDYATDYYAYGGNGNGFMKYMWDTYRNDYGDTVTPASPTGLSVL